MHGETYFVPYKILGPTVLCTPFRMFPTCKSALVGAVLRNVKRCFSLLCRYIYRSLVLYCKKSLAKCALVTRNAKDKRHAAH